MQASGHSADDAIAIAEFLKQKKSVIKEKWHRLGEATPDMMAASERRHFEIGLFKSARTKNAITEEIEATIAEADEPADEEQAEAATKEPDVQRDPAPHNPKSKYVIVDDPLTMGVDGRQWALMDPDVTLPDCGPTKVPSTCGKTVTYSRTNGILTVREKKREKLPQEGFDRGLALLFALHTQMCLNPAMIYEDIGAEIDATAIEVRKAVERMRRDGIKSVKSLGKLAATGEIVYGNQAKRAMADALAAQMKQQSVSERETELAELHAYGVEDDLVAWCGQPETLSVGQLLEVLGSTLNRAKNPITSGAQIAALADFELVDAIESGISKHKASRILASARATFPLAPCGTKSPDAAVNALAIH